MKKFFATIAKWWDKWTKICKILAGVVLSVIFILYIICVVSGWVQNFIPKYSIISTVSENDSLAVYEYFDKRGYINVNNNEVVISARKNDYEKAWLFSEGLAAVMKDGKIGFINAANEVVIPFEFHCSSRYSCYKFENGHCVISNKDGKMGVIDTSGRWVLEPVFDEIQSPCEFSFTFTKECENDKYVTYSFFVDKYGGGAHNITYKNEIVSLCFICRAFL